MDARKTKWNTLIGSIAILLGGYFKRLIYSFVMVVNLGDRLSMVMTEEQNLLALRDSIDYLEEMYQDQLRKYNERFRTDTRS